MPAVHIHNASVILLCYFRRRIGGRVVGHNDFVRLCRGAGGFWQAFFGAWSKLWGQQVSENVAAERLAAEIHAPGPLRSNVPLSNLPAFGAAYGCKAGQPMQRAEADQVRVWR